MEEDTKEKGTKEEENTSQDQILPDPNQIVELRTEFQGIGLPIESDNEDSKDSTDTSDTDPTELSAPFTLDLSASEIKMCQDTLKKAIEEVYRDFSPDAVATMGFDHLIGGMLEDIERVAVPQDAAADVDTSIVPSRPIGEVIGGGPKASSNAPLGPTEEASPTASLSDLKEGIEGLGDRIQDLLADLNIEIEYEKTEKGAKLRFRSKSEEAMPDDKEILSEEPEVREIERRVSGGGTVTVSVRPSGSGTAFATADGDVGAGAHNNTVGYINKRTKGLIVNEFGQIYSVINLGLTLQFLVGVEED